MPVRLVVVALVLVAGFVLAPAPARAVTLPSGFEQSTAIPGLDAPTDIEIAANGRVFVAEKSGLVKTFDSLSDTSPATFADLRTQVHNFSSRGLLGLAVDPGFPLKPYVYVFYTLDAPIGGTPPTFGAPGQTQDQCPGDPDLVNCVVSSRVSRLHVSGDRMDAEEVLVNDWCQQYPFHTGGGLEFGADGYLYVSGGDGARWGIWDYGQLGFPNNPCGDPPGGIGGAMTPPTAEGGRLRAQDLRTSGDPLGLAGSLSRIDPATGAGVPGNPMFTSAEANAQRMLAHGFRNPARLAIRPGTSDVWVGDRGGGYWEELDRVQGGADPVHNFGWPCYEGGLDANGVPYTRIRPRSNDHR
jgi:glucose/arabinose dehydrogenase